MTVNGIPRPTDTGHPDRHQKISRHRRHGNRATGGPQRHFKRRRIPSSIPTTTARNLHDLSRAIVSFTRTSFNSTHGGQHNNGNRQRRNNPSTMHNTSSRPNRQGRHSRRGRRQGQTGRIRRPTRRTIRHQYFMSTTPKTNSRGRHRQGPHRRHGRQQRTSRRRNISGALRRTVGPRGQQPPHTTPAS